MIPLFSNNYYEMLLFIGGIVSMLGAFGVFFTHIRKSHSGKVVHLTAEKQKSILGRGPRLRCKSCGLQFQAIKKVACPNCDSQDVIPNPVPVLVTG